jgi:hypothetical protein
VELGLDARAETGGADRDRTDDLLNANQALSQLSYSPLLIEKEAEETPEDSLRPLPLTRLSRPVEREARRQAHSH